MFTAFLIVVTAAVVTGTEAPKVYASFKTIEDCQIAAVKVNRELGKELAEKGGIASCVKLLYPV